MDPIVSSIPAIALIPSEGEDVAGDAAGQSCDPLKQRILDEFIETLKSTTLAGSMLSLILSGSNARTEALSPPARHAFNDFDFYLITPTRTPPMVFRAFVEELKKKAARSAHRYRVDLHVPSLAELRNALPVIRYVDLRMHGRVLAGRDVLCEMPAFGPSDLPVFEGFRRMLNAVFFFFERAEYPEPEEGLLAYLYTEAASAFAIGAGAHGKGCPAILDAIEVSPFGLALRSQVDDFAGKFSSSWSKRWGGPSSAASSLPDWTTALRDYGSMIDIYADCSWGCHLSRSNPDGRPDREAAALRTISRKALAPYAHWAIRQKTGIEASPEGLTARLAAGIYQAATNVPVFLTTRNRGWPLASDLAVHHGLKIYWAGRQLLERVAGAGPGFSSTPGVTQDVRHFVQTFRSYFLRDPRTRSTLVFGSGLRRTRDT